VAQPLVGHFHLPAVLEDLIEDTELVPDTVSERRIAKRSQRIEVAGGQPAESAVAEPRLFLEPHELLQIQTEFCHRLACVLGDPEVEQIAAEMAPDPFFRRTPTGSAFLSRFTPRQNG
jgi:hypothetical protein